MAIAHALQTAQRLVRRFHYTCAHIQIYYHTRTRSSSVLRTRIKCVIEFPHVSALLKLHHWCDIHTYTPPFSRANDGGDVDDDDNDGSPMFTKQSSEISCRTACVCS